MTSFRMRRGTDATGEIHAASRARTTVSVDLLIDTFNQLKLQPTPTTVKLSGATRGIGLNVVHEYDNALTALQKAAGLADVNSICRVTLGQLDVQLLESEPRGTSLNEHVQIEQPRISPCTEGTLSPFRQNSSGTEG